MAQANAAYYAAHDPFADFTTAPEISQVFGELIGAWVAVVWEQMRAPKFLLAEAGPGRGTLIADILRTLAAVAPACRAAASIHLIETSPRLRALQAAAAPGATWHDAVTQLPPGPLILIANEFLDALPIRQFVHRGTWRERFVADGAFIEHPAGLDHPGTQGDIRETRDPALPRWLGARLAAAPGAALILDYGPERSAPGNSLQALRDGRPADPLADPGHADLTAHVDFQAFAEAAAGAGATAHGPIPQGRFLSALGLFPRTHRLAATVPPARAAALIDAAQRLAAPERMGRLFKALALCHPGQSTPPGFEPS